MKKGYILLILCYFVGVLCVYAQDEPRMKQPDLQTTEFFDPTREKVKEPYIFSTDWRLEMGYVQWDERNADKTIYYQHGMRLGATVDFNLPHRFSVQTGALATLTYGLNQQNWRSLTDESTQIERLNNHIIQLQLTIPVRAYYNIKLWKKLNMFFYAGPQLQLGLTNYDMIVDKNHNFMGSKYDKDGKLISSPISQELSSWLIDNNIISTDANGNIINQDQYVNHRLYRTNIQFGLGGGFEWDRYRVQAGYDFGLNNLIRTAIVPKQQLSEWGWMVGFAYKL